MKLYFYRRNEKQPNFGDELNLWLWEKLIPGVLDDNEETAFFGLGTVMNNLVSERVPNAKKIVVFSSGVGYAAGPPNITDDWTVYCLRGPLSAYKLGLSPDLAVADGGILVRRVFKPTLPKIYKFSYIPHFTQSIDGNNSWSEVCERAGVNYIDARWPIEKVLTAIAQTEVLLAEAMHGAIVAEALRVPWICVHTNLERLLPFKWLDWCESIGVKYRPRGMMKLRDLPPQYGIKGIRGLRGSRAAVMASLTQSFAKRKTVAEMLDIIKRQEPTLSDDNTIENLTVELETRLEKFKNDVAAGRFN